MYPNSALSQQTTQNRYLGLSWVKKNIWVNKNQIKT